MLEKFARYPLTFGPSYIHPLERLSAYLGNVVRTTVLPDLMASLMAFIWRRFLPQWLQRPFNRPTVTGAAAHHYRTLAMSRSL